jgi:nicotinate-nucleotide--dimethylbenzimidazole phosphoribosyltransferase
MIASPPLHSPGSIGELLAEAPQPDIAAREAAAARQQELTKPPGSLGRLEEIGIWLSGWQGTARPRIERTEAIVFAGNHGVVAEGVSPYPSEVTRQMVANYDAGGAAINALARVFGLGLRVVPLDLDRPTGSIARMPAMTEAECLAALNAGAAAIDGKADAYVLGEMGIGNTTIAAALAAATLGGSGGDWAGAGTGLDAPGIAAKAAVVDQALALHRPHMASAFEILRRVGGREQAAIAGAVLKARLLRRPVILDGFVVTAAAAVLTRQRPDALTHCLAGHVSAERGHRRLLEGLGLAPLLDLGMRLGEGTGAAVASALLRAAAATQSQMATFAEAKVSDRAD